MKTYLFLLLLPAIAAKGSLYQNTFDSAAALNDFDVYGERFSSYDPPPLHEVSVVGGQLVIQTTYLQPNYPDSAPTLLGLASLSLNTSLWGPAYKPVLAQNVGGISWSINVANADGAFNNKFFMVLASTAPDPFDLSARGYAFTGGGMVGNRMGLWRFDHGLGGGQGVLIDVLDGLGPSPQTGSFRIEFNPLNNEWKLFGAIEDSYQDATMITSLLGTGTDGTYTSLAAPYFALGGGTTGTDYFDNLVVTIPEPGIGCLGALCGVVFSCRSRLKRGSLTLGLWR